MSFATFECEHIVDEKHGGATAADNLAFAYPFCNRFKGTDLGSLDPDTGQLTPFFHPEICHDAKKEGYSLVCVHSPAILGDTYRELVRSLELIAQYRLKLRLMSSKRAAAVWAASTSGRSRLVRPALH